MDLAILKEVMDKKLQIDTHCHSVASAHAICTIGEIVSRAKKVGLKGVVITDHHPSLGYTCDDYRMRAPDDAYFSVFCKRYKNLDPDVEVFRGIELNILDYEPWVTTPKSSYDKGLDFKIASVHMVPHLFKKGGSISENTKAMLNAINFGAVRPFHVLGHPIMNGAMIDIEEIVKACESRNIALELNNSYLLYNKGDASLIERMLELAAVHECFISVGSDSHVENEVGLLSEATKLLQKINFPERLIINRTLETFKEFCNIN